MRKVTAERGRGTSVFPNLIFLRRSNFQPWICRQLSRFASAISTSQAYLPAFIFKMKRFDYWRQPSALTFKEAMVSLFF